ncbi:MAG: single-stranded DNA-binding protein [Verrucomicrobia bacterium]|nr:single-stranded DNA-binding protein [Verrucomicrobiota bacterium]
MNQATIAGHLGADPEVRFTSSGKKVTTLRVAARARRSGKDETIWWKVTIWGEQFDNILPYFKKGSPIIVFGEMNKPEMFTDREGRQQVSMSMTALNIQFSPFGKPDQQHGSDGAAAAPTHAPQSEMAYAGHDHSAHGQGKGDVSFTDDEIPF